MSVRARTAIGAGADPLTDPVPVLLRDGSLVVEGQLVGATNTTLLCRLVDPGEGVAAEATMRCVYKPITGERPLWDFPVGTLGLREVAAYLVSEAAGWHVVPPTILRDGPYGPGMCQQWVEHDGTQLADVLSPEQVPVNWMQVFDAVDEVGNPVVLAHADDSGLRTMALFDVVVNNADRKGGHVLVDRSGGVFGVDHGVCFHPEPKLRTVLWGWVDSSLTAAERGTLLTLRARLDGQLGSSLAGLLAPEEIEATKTRLAELLRGDRFPSPDPGRVAIPWPPF
jgi:uncharacterized repeat protein (TIGR03843 family)